MKLLFFDDYQLGVLKNDTSCVDVMAACTDIEWTHPQDLIGAVIETFSARKSAIDALVEASDGVPLDSVRIRPPLPRPGTIDCMAVNYMEDGTRDEPARIQAFQKSPSAIIGHGDEMVLPDDPSTIYEGEAELAIVIGKRASNVAAADALDYVFGYTNFIDGSARGLGGFSVFHAMKSRDTFAPVGPYIVTADEVARPQNLRVTLANNGVVMQDFNTDDMAHDIERCIEYVSAIHTLEPGDILATGTNHGGLHPFQDGDVVELECEGLGQLRITVRDDLKRTWKRESRVDRHELGLEDTTPQLTGKYS